MKNYCRICVEYLPNTVNCSAFLQDDTQNQLSFFTRLPEKGWQMAGELAAGLASFCGMPFGKENDNDRVLSMHRGGRMAPVPAPGNEAGARLS
jgi:hypothetical protein